jgi:signal transduction histidine kinase/CheY-like chemotaxis protein/HAMP domain-containing protein
VEGVAGTWKDLTDNVNLMASNLTSQVRNIAGVTTAVANGDLSKKITVDVKGEILELKNTINTMVDQLSSFASEVTRVAREVGTEGNLGGQARVEGVAGTWKDLTDNVNLMASNLTSQVRNIAAVTTAVANGDLSKKITVDVKGEILELKNTINTMVDQLSSFASEVTRVAREVGTEGRLGGQALVKGIAGTWKDLTDSVNSMASNLTGQVRNIAEVTTAVATGNLSKKITVDVKGEILELKITINTMVDQLRSFASEVTRVAREVGTEGKLGGQAEVKGISGTWKDLTDNVNSMAGNLTSQVRGIAKVVTAVAHGDLKQKLAVDAKGEIAALADTINSMIDTLATFADQVTTVAREVGVEGKLGGQASVPGAAGTWKDLTDNVNRLAANLTSQVRAIAEVATAVTEGDLTRSIKVEAQGEVAALKDNINEMIRNLKDTTLKNSEQDWLKTNLAKFSRMLQGQKDLLTVGNLILSELAPVVGSQQGVFYVWDADPEEPELRLLAGYATQKHDQVSTRFRLGEGLVGQCALGKQRILLGTVPEHYVQISSGLGAGIPQSLVVLPIIFEGQVKGVLELASFERFSHVHLAFLDQLMESIGIVINTIEANMRTENLLMQSQSLAEVLQIQQQELKDTNEQLEEKARLLAHQNVEVERKNREVELARQALEEKARQLALTSKYKSEFLANMSHELRTPLNSLLILSDQLAKNPECNLTPRQLEFAETIHASGNDLLTLINDILDLTKIESGTVILDIGELRFTELKDYVERTFRHVAEAKSVEFTVDLEPRLPGHILTDAKRLQQVIRNLLSNAFKFTHEGSVSLHVAPVTEGWAADHNSLNGAETVLAISVSDTGIGISPEKQQIIFEAFQQADGGTSRKYGGTGLGLAISRELASLLGGEIRLVSSPGVGSTFTFYLPQEYSVPKPARKHSPSLTNGLGRLASGAAATPQGPLDPGLSSNELGDDRDRIHPGDEALLVVSNDEWLSRGLMDVSRENGFRVLAVSRGASAVALVREHKPCAIALDTCLQDIEGWRVLQCLKNDCSTRHIPVYVISTEQESARALRLGAHAVLAKPIKARERLDQALAIIRGFLGRQASRLLLAHPDDTERSRLLGLITGQDVQTVSVSTGREALARISEQTPDCVVLDAALPEMAGLELADQIIVGLGHRALPVLVYAPQELEPEQERRFRQLSRHGTLHHVRSADQLLDQTTLFLHRPLEKLSGLQRQTLEKLYEADTVLAEKKVLIVDDDIRNIFAMTSILERHNVRVIAAETGTEAIDRLQREHDIDLLLMDIMMPDLDGYDTIRAIRKHARFGALPIIAVTAKAMKGDREKCIEAGAWDYLSKPVDSGHMLAVLRAWLRR